MKKQQTYFYSNEHDEVKIFNIKKTTIDENYKYSTKNPFYNFLSLLTYWFFAKPIAWFYFVIIKRVKFKNKHVMKNYKKSSYFIYSNHTQQYCDCFCPALICLNKKPHIIVNADNISISFWGKLLKMWGALPLPDNLSATKNFYSAIENTLSKNNPIVIYPEAHLWPYYTKIREFNNVSFRYPIKYNKPVFTFTTVYKRKKLGKKPKILIYVDGPFFADQNLSDKEKQQNLRDKVYLQLKNRASLSNYEFVKYIKRSTSD